jgi:tetratricopeptide (TPR) repeat protein
VKKGFVLGFFLSICALFLVHPQLSFPTDANSGSPKYLNYLDEGTKRLLLDGIEASFRENYPVAESSFNRLIHTAPKDPAGYFFKAALYQAEMIDYESDFREKGFYENVRLAKDLAGERIQDDRKDAWAYLLLGNAYGAKGLYDARKGNWWSGLNNGLSAKSALKEAMKQNPELYDAYVGLGSYHYWASVVTKAFWWLPFFGDHREEGMKEMKLAYEKSIFSSDAAANGLVWMYIQEKKFASALDLAQKMQDKYPEGKSFLWALAQAYYEKRDWNDALSKYQELLHKIENGSILKELDQSYNLIECQFYIANCLFSLGRYGECASVCQKVLNLPLDDKVKKRQKSRLRTIQKLSEKAQEFARMKS